MNTNWTTEFDGAAHLDHAIAQGAAGGGCYIHGHPSTGGR